MGGIAVGLFVVIGLLGQRAGPADPVAATKGPEATRAALASTPSPTVSVTQRAAPTATPTARVTPAPTPVVTPPPTPKPTPVVTLPPTTYETLTSRQWAKVVKSPDDYLGETYKLWGCISQFDAATGDDAFRAQASYRREDYWYSDGENALFSGDADELSDFVADDVVVMDVTAFGSFTYDTQIGGSTTVPLFYVDKITRKGDCS